MAINRDIEVGKEEQTTVPLLQQEKSAAGYEEYESKESDEGSICMVLLSTCVAVCGSFEFGTCVGYSSPVQSGIRDDLGLSLSEYSVFGSILTIGAMIGAVTSGRITDLIGRKGAMRMSAVFCLTGWLAIFFSQGALSLYAGRFCSGYGIGVLSYAVPVFIAEITPKHLRGGLTTLNQLLICTGLSVVFIIGTVVSWRLLTLVGLVPCFILLFGLLFVPESPRWLAKVGREKEFEVALRKLRGKNADISMEAAEIQDNIETLESLPKAGIQDLFQRRYALPVIVGVGLMVSQQFGGINGIAFYASETFVSAGFSNGKMGTIAMGCIQVPVTILGAILMDKTGRRPLLLISASGTFLGCLLAGFSFLLKGHDLLLGWVPVLALSGVLVYLGSFSLGMGAVPWVMMSEIFPINMKGIAGSLVTLVNWFGSWAVSYTFNFLMSWSSSGTFFLYAGVSAVTVVFVVKLVPETKGKTLEQIQISMSSEGEK